jgi:hypothetical protein
MMNVAAVLIGLLCALLACFAKCRVTQSTKQNAIKQVVHHHILMTE